MKKHVLNTFILLLLNTFYSCAQASLVPSGRSVTYRVGGGFAGEYASIDVDVKNKPTVVASEDGEFSSNGHHVCRKFQISPNIELGAFLYGKYYLGFSLSKSYTNAKSSMKVPMTTIYNFEHKFKLKNYVNAFFNMGYKPTPSLMLFCSIGPSFANWSHGTKVFYYDQMDSFDSKKDLKNSDSPIKSTGLGLGAGVEYWVSKNATVSFKYGLNLHRAKTIRYDYTYDQLVLNDAGLPNIPERNGDAQKSVRLTHSTIGLRFSYFFSF